ncbi:MAG: selenide, water dikinase SelD [Rhodocyclaceae bacterium]|nr:selenide, water dikinase SelD [Rhodocyclaceae bacterium]
MTEPIKLTQFSHGGGCGCKISPAILSQLIAQTPLANLPADLLVGVETADDAAVYRLNDQQAVVVTTDFFTPIVDNPRDFGRIAATNALSDIYAMGARPLFALAVVGMPLDKLPLAVIREILDGGQSVCTAAGIPLAGGHSIDVLEPIYGLVGVGVVHPDQLKRNAGAQAGDVLILGKPLGVGILSAALKKNKLSAHGYAQLLDYTTRLNTPGAALAELPEVHAMTDVTGFGLAGHLLEICRGSSLGAVVDWARLPLLDEAVTHVQNGVVTGASGRNWAAYGEEVAMPAGAILWQEQLLSDPQTSGGLLVACAPESEARVLAIFHAAGFELAARVGRMVTRADGAPRLSLV